MLHIVLRASLILLFTPTLLVAQTNLPLAAPPVLTQQSAQYDAVTLPDIVFGKGGTQDLHAQITYPKNATGLLPAIIHIHGGAWKMGSYEWPPLAHFAQAGYFAVSIEYRLSTVAKWPAQIQDCKLAVRWLRANAAQYNVDPNRIGVIGESAGGHLVACLGTMTNVKEYEGDGGYPGVSSAVEAVADFYGPTDFTNPKNYKWPWTTLKVAEELFGAPYKQNPDLWKSGSPLSYVVAGDPPMLIVHGNSDNVVPLAQSTNLDDALAKAGVPHQLMVIKNAGHGFKPDPGTQIDPSREVIDQTTLDFFGKYLGATTKPPNGM